MNFITDTKIVGVPALPTHGSAAPDPSAPTGSV